MTKKLEQNIERMEADLKSYTENATAEIEAMKQKLKHGDKFKFQGGDYRMALNVDGFQIENDTKVLNCEKPYRTKTQEAGERLKKHVKNQILLWQVAEFVNDGWVRPKVDIEGVFKIFYDYGMNNFQIAGASVSSDGIFKDIEAASRACKILNEQADELGWVK